MKASETETGKAALSSDGVHVASVCIVYISLGDNVIEVPLSSLAGKSKDQIMSIIGEEAAEQLKELNNSVESHVARNR